MFKNFIIAILMSVITYNSNFWEVKSLWLFAGLVIVYEIVIQSTAWAIEERLVNEKGTMRNSNNGFNVSVLRRYNKSK